MNLSEGSYGTLLFFRKDGKAGTPYPFCCGKTTIGSSKDADIRLKLNSKDLEPIHCIIDVNDVGIATLLNKSVATPVTVNGRIVKKIKVLSHRDQIELVGKHFQYLNEEISQEDIKRHQKNLNQGVSTPSKKRRSVAPLIKSAKKSQTLRTKIPVQQRISVRKSFAGSNTEFTVSLTPGGKLDKRSIVEKCNTTSKVIVSKALRSPTTPRKRRLSLDSSPKKFIKTPRRSTKNSFLAEKIVSSTITEEDLTLIEPSHSMKNVEEEGENDGFLDESNVTVDHQTEISPPKRRTSLRTPSKSSIKITMAEPTPNTPANKRIDLLKTPQSAIKSSPLYKSSPRVSHSAKRVSKTHHESDIVFSPKESVISTPNNRRSSTRKNRELQMDTIDSPREVIVLSDQSGGSSDSVRTRSSISAKKNNVSQKDISSKYSTEETRITDDEDLSSEESEIINLSSSSSISPVKSMSRNSVVSIDSSDNLSPRRSIFRKSLRRSQLKKGEGKLNGRDPKQSSEENITVEIASPVRSNRTSYVKENEMESPEKYSVRQSLSRSLLEEQSLQQNKSIQDKFADKSVRKSRHSLRKSNVPEEAKFENVTQNIIMQNEQSQDGFADKSSIKSRSSLKNSKVMEGEESTILNISISSVSPAKSLRRSSLATTTSGDELSLRWSILKKSMRKSQVGQISLDGKETDPSSDEEPMNAEITSPVRSKRASYVQENANEVEFPEISNRRNSTRSGILLEEQLVHKNEQTQNTSANKSIRKSRNSLRKSKFNEKEEKAKELEPSSEESTTYEETDSPINPRESVSLNMSTSSVLPEKRRSRSIFGVDSGDNSSPRRSILKKSRMQLSLNGKGIDQSPTVEPINIEFESPARSKRLSYVQKNNINLSGRISSRSSIPLRECSLRENETIPDDVAEKSMKSLRHSDKHTLSKNQVNQEEENDTQSSSEESYQESDSSLKLRESVTLNLSSSFRSPAKSLRKSSLVIIDLDDTESPRRSSVRKSLRRSQNEVSAIGEETEQLSSEELINIETDSPVRSRRSSYVREKEMEPSPAERNTRKLSRNSTNQVPVNGKETEQLSSEELINIELDSSVRSRRSSYVRGKEMEPSPAERSARKSSRRSSILLTDQSLQNNEWEEDAIANNSIRESPRKSQNQVPAIGEETIQLSSEELINNEIDSSVRSRRSSYVRGKEMELPPAERSVRKSSRRSSILLKDQSLQKNEWEENNFANNSIRKSRHSLSMNKGSRGAKEENETQSSSEESTYQETSSPLESKLTSKRLSNFKESGVEPSPIASSRRQSIKRNSMPEKSPKETEKSSPNKTLTKSRPSLNKRQLNEKDQSSSEEDFELCLVEDSSEESLPEETLSKTVSDEVELETPKSAIKSRRSKSLPYNPVTEDITPVSPIVKIKTDSGFKTPLNTPGLFENIRRSVLRSRSRTQRSGSNFIDELNKVEPKTKAVKRSRESSEEGSVRPSKRRKIMEAKSHDSSDTCDEDLNSTFESFRTEDILSDISDPDVFQTTPEHFNDLTDKPVINEPRTRSLTEPKKTKAALSRRSLNTGRLESQFTSVTSTPGKSDAIISATSFSSELSDNAFEHSYVSEDNSRKRVQKSPKNDLSDVAGLKKLLRTPKEIKSPKNDLTDVRGVKNLLQTPKTMKSPKNDLTNIPNLKKLMSPKTVNSPKNDLENIVRFKHLLKTPQVNKSPKNDLTDIRGVKKLLQTPKAVNSPKNDLTNIPNLKKLLSPKSVNSPNNDLRKVPNLRRLMSPKTQNSPRNDLSDVAGVKNLLSTPPVQNSPKNDLTNVPNLRRIMSPKQQNTPRNDLTEVRGVKRLMKTPRKIKEPINDLSNVEGVASIFNVSGVHRLSNESDIENNEDLFDKLFVKKPLKTYRGRSLSPTARKAMLYKEQRKTLGDTPVMSPRVEKWVAEQAVIKLQKVDDVFEIQNSKLTEESNLSSKGRKKPQEKKSKTEVLDQEKAPKRNLRRKNVEVGDLIEETSDKPESPKRMPRGRKKNVEKTEVGELRGNVPGTDIVEVDNPETPKKTLRGRRKVAGKIEPNYTPEVSESDLKEMDKPETPKKIPRGRRKVAEKVNSKPATAEADSNESKPETDKPEPSRRAVRGRRNIVEKTEDKPTSEMANTKETVIEIDLVEPKSNKKGTRNRKKAADEDIESIVSSDRIQYTDGGNEVDSTSSHSLTEIKLQQTRRGRPKKTASKQEDNQIAEVHSTTNELDSPAPRRRPGRKAAIVEEKQDTDNSDIEIVSVEPRRGRPRKVAEKEKVDSSEEVAKREPVTKTRGRRTLRVEEEKANGNKLNTPEIIKKSKGKKKATEEDKLEKDEEPVRSTRGRGQRNAKQTEPEEAPVRATTKKTKKEVLVEEVVIDSPRTTRAKRGNFQKYGDDFVTVGSPRSEPKPAKKVQFVLTQDEEGATRKRRGRNVTKSEEVEETTRKSKRVRK